MLESISTQDNRSANMTYKLLYDLWDLNTGEFSLQNSYDYDCKKVIIMTTVL